MHATYCQDAWPADVFWEKLSDTVMSSVTDDNQSCHEMQLETFSGKVLTITQASSGRISDY